MNHFIAYVRWDIILDWQKEEIQAGKISKKSRVKPYAYGTGAKGILDNAKEGDILWILTIPKYGEYSSYPSLNAMIVVKEIIDQKYEKEEKNIEKIPEYIRKKWDPIEEKGWRYVIIGDKDKSKYFPINDSYGAIVKPVLKEKILKLEERMKGENLGYIAQHFQKIRGLEKDLGKKILKYQEEIQKKEVLFISYRRGKGNRIVKDMVERLLKEKIICWLDISRIPQDLVKEKCKEIEKYFEYELVNAIEESNGFLSIQRRDYWNSKWTVLEYSTAKNEEKKRTQKGKNYYFGEVELNRVSEKEERRRLVKRIIKELTGNSAPPNG